MAGNIKNSIKRDKGSMLIYLADFRHDYLPARNYTPTGIGYIASYAKSVLNNAAEFQLFKSPDLFLNAFDKEKPDIIGFSNYIWNAEVTNFVGKYVKQERPEIPMVMGGPHIHTDKRGMEKDLRNRSYVDKYMLFAGERSFSEIALFINEKIKYGRKGNLINELRSKIIDGCFSIDLETDMLTGNCQYHTFDDLDQIPSPFLNGYMDPFLERGMCPILETNRGCPYSCTFCSWGSSSLGKVREFSIERVKKELDYIAYNFKVQTIFFADANFGILGRDVEIAAHIRSLYEATKAFYALRICSTKNFSTKIIEIGKHLGPLWIPDLAAQSFNSKVLENIKRINIRTEDLPYLIKELRNHTNLVVTAILVGLPGDTYDSHLSSLDYALEIGFEGIGGGETLMLPSSEIETEKYRKKYGIKTKFRLSEGQYGIYHGKFVYELEEGIRETNTMNEKDMIKLRFIRAFFFLSVSVGEHRPLNPYLIKMGLKITKVCEQVAEEGKKDPLLAEIIFWLIDQADKEWFETKEDVGLYVEAGDIQKDILYNNKIIKLNTGFAAQIYLLEECYNTYYNIYSRVLHEMLPKHEAATIKEYLDLCRKRNFLVATLRGKPRRTFRVKLNKKTLRAMLESEYLTQSIVDNSYEGLEFSIHQSAADYIEQYVKDNPEKTVLDIAQLLLVKQRESFFESNS